MIQSVEIYSKDKDMVDYFVKHEPPKIVGAYDWGNVHVQVTRKPNWFQRKMIKYVFGWKWVDASNHSGGSEI